MPQKKNPKKNKQEILETIFTLSQKERVEFCRFDSELFLATYIPHFAPGLNHGQFQLDAFGFINEILTRSNARKGTYPLKKKNKIDLSAFWKAIAAPRGHAKTTLFSIVLPLMVILYNLKNFVVMLGANEDLSLENINSIRDELEGNPELTEDFPDACGSVMGTKDIVTNNGIRVKSYGVKTRIRGVKHRFHRPDLILVDDIENDENIKSLEQRDKMDNFLWKAVTKLGPPDKSHDVLFLGTIMHYDAVLNRNLKHPRFTGVKYKALIRYPENQNLWKEFESIFYSSSTNGLDLAKEFYKKNKKKMDKGAKVLWPGMQPLLSLMIDRVSNPKSFDTEMQNEPINVEDQFFKNICYTSSPPEKFSYIGSIGKKIHDIDAPVSITVAACIKSPLDINIIENEIGGMSPTDVVRRIIDLQREYDCEKWVMLDAYYEKVLKSHLDRELKANELKIQTSLIMNSDLKFLIEEMQPLVNDGMIKFSSSHMSLLDQMKFFPQYDYQTGPESVGMIAKIASQRLTVSQALMSANV